MVFMKINELIALFLTIVFFVGCKENLPPELTPEEIEQQQIEAIFKVLDAVDPIADEALKSDNPAEELQKVAEQFKDNPEIEDIYFERDKLVLKFKNAGYFFWLIKKNIATSTKALQSRCDAELIKTTKSFEKKIYPKILFIYRHTLDPDRAVLNDYTRNYINNKIELGYNITPVYGENFDLDFAASGLASYDGIFIGSHGTFDKITNLTWILTGERRSKIDIIQCLKEWNKIAFEMSEDGLYDIMISQKFFDDNYNDAVFPKNSFIYLGACQTMMDSKNRFASVLHRKGISKIVGYNNSTMSRVNVYNAHAILNKLLVGESYNDAFASLNELGCYARRKGEENSFDILPPDNGNNGVKRQEIYKSNRKTLDYETNLVSYPADTDFRFHFLKLAEENVSLPLAVGHVKEIAILSGSNNYEVVSSDSQVATASVTSEKVTITALAEGQARITVTDKDTQLTSMLDVVVRTKQKHKIEEIIPETYLEVLEDLEFPIYDGENPPIINGTYDISPLILKATNKTSDFPIGHRFADAVLRFYNQNNETFEIQVKEKYDTQETSSIQTAITSGDGSNFTVYGTVKAVEIDNPSVYIVTASVYSGTLNSDGSIKDFAMSFICVDKNDPEGKYINKGDARVVIDGDYHSPKTTWTSTRSWSVDALPTITAKRE